MNKIIYPIIVLIVGSIIILTIYYYYSFYFVSLANDPFHFTNPNMQIIKDKEVIKYYESLQYYNDYGLSIPVGLKNCHVLFLFNIATTNSIEDVPIYSGHPKTCTLEVVQESLGGAENMFRFIEKGELSMLDIFPVRIPDNQHIGDLSNTLIKRCIQFTSTNLIEIINPKYIVSFGEGGKLLLRYMQQNNNLFAVEPFDNPYDLEMYNIILLEQNISYIFIKSIHPSSIYYNISIEQAEYLDNIFKFIRGTILQTKTINEKIFSYKKFVKHKKMGLYHDIRDSSITHCLGKNNYI
jgi:hypothetical protein